MSRAVLSIGSNLGDRLASLQSVLDKLDGAVQAVSPVYQTAPWGGVEQDDFLNAILIAADAALQAADWLALAQDCEQAAGRVRQQRWGPRTLDVDIIDVDGMRSDSPRLTLPHPRAFQRAFVLLPWLDVDPEAALAERGRVADLVAALPAAERAEVRRRDDLALVASR